MLKDSYKDFEGLANAVNDIDKSLDKWMDEKDTAILTNEFVKWNDKNMFHLTGQSRLDVKKQSNYKDGEVVGRNPYFEYAYEHNISGQERPFEYTFEERVKDIEDLQIRLLDEKLK